MPSLATPPLRASITSFLAPAAQAQGERLPLASSKPLGGGSAQRAIGASSGPRHSLFNLFLQILDGLLTPEPRSPQSAPYASMRGRHATESLDVPAYLRRGVRIPELD